MDFSKVFEFIRHDLIITKKAVYGMQNESLSIFLSYFTNWKQCVKKNTTYSAFIEIISGYLRGLFLDPFSLTNWSTFKVIVKRAEPYQCDIRLVSTILWQKRITRSLKNGDYDILYSPATFHHNSSLRGAIPVREKTFSSEKTCDVEC